MKEKYASKSAKLTEICASCGKSTERSTSPIGWIVGEKRCKCLASLDSTENLESVKQMSLEGNPHAVAVENTLPSNVCQPGDIIARHFKVLSCLGAGGMSVVYKAHHLLLDKVFAVKVLLPDSIPNKKMLMRFQQEAKAVSRLRHDNIVQIHELGLDDSGMPFIVMDYVEGRPLSTVIAEAGKLSLERTIDFAKQAAIGLQHAHEEGIVHRDIKPANIIITVDDQGREILKIVDFGIAKIQTPEPTKVAITQTGELFGSPGYMSPEQCYGKVVDNRSDLYSLGCVLYECLFGEPPFHGDGHLATIMMHIQQAVSIDEKVSGAPMKNVLLRCLEKAPESRYQSAAELHKDLLLAENGITPQRLIKTLATKQLSVKQIVGIVGLMVVTIFGAMYFYYFSSTGTVAGTVPPPLPNGEVRTHTVEEIKAMHGQFYGSSIEDLAPGKIPPHFAPSLGDVKAGDAYAEADAVDRSTLMYFQSQEYEKAIPLLMFATQTYKEGGRHYNNDPDIETDYLGDAYQHLGQCYVKLGQFDKAVVNYKECLRLYAKVTKKAPLYDAAISGYSNLLDQLGKEKDRVRMVEEYKKNGRVTNIP